MEKTSRVCKFFLNVNQALSFLLILSDDDCFDVIDHNDQNDHNSYDDDNTNNNINNDSNEGQNDVDYNYPELNKNT